MITITRYALILMAILVAPFYGLWVFGGWIADKRGQRRALAVMKDHRESLTNWR